MLTMMLKSTKYQYSLRLDLPPKTAYFLSASRYQLNPKTSPSPRASCPFVGGDRSMPPSSTASPKLCTGAYSYKKAERTRQPDKPLTAGFSEHDPHCMMCMFGLDEGFV